MKNLIGYVCFGEVNTPIERLQMKHDEALAALQAKFENVVDGYNKYYTLSAGEGSTKQYIETTDNWNITANTTGSNVGHQNKQPCLTCRCMIKY